jgi:hypothetical protein
LGMPSGRATALPRVGAMRRLSVLLFAALVVVAAACGGSDDDVSVGGDPSSTTSSPSTSEATTSTTAAETTTTAPASGLVLGADGVGTVSFGQDPDSAIAALTSVLGEPSSDSGFVDAASSPYGFCPAPQVRGVVWGGLTLLFSDGDTAYGTAGEQAHLFTYLLDGTDPAATTEAGVGVGSTSEQVRAAYPEAVQVPGDELVAPRFDVDLGGTEPLRLTLDDAGTVTAVTGGAPCGE